MYDPIRASDAVIARLRANHPSLIDLTTGRVERLLAALGHPERQLPPVIHVAGTNGKGSTVAYMRAMAEAAGLKVHVLTSPHLVRFAERIRVAGELITDARLEALIGEVEAVNAGQPISFFEITTVIALQAFAQTPADLCLIEVGLGGRFDATNVFDAPDLCVITPVDYDHLEMLGPELSKIAWEKAGIIKAGRPVVVAHQMEEGLDVVKAQAEALGAPMTLMGVDADAWEADGRLLVQLGERLLDLPPPALFGPHQFDNAGVAVAALLTLNDPRIDEAAMGRGVASAQWPARFQRLTQGRLGEMAADRGAVLWLDGGHNPHAGAALAQSLLRLTARDPRPVVLITAMFARKDAVGFFAPFADLRPRVVATSFDSPNAAPAEEIATAARTAGLDAQIADDVTAALSAALSQEGPAPHILICGGLHFAGDVLAMDPETWPR
ncbi:MAG: bifunctional folylpolyglutamate synthase/dihydrofolate synthase [Phenylobacterium sp.]|uniref:bifunctional folylpolyglutamate synthase/dihydrofolate synthase n=1 Tax=Phenylobacterium sp. TaxID=1871053 RepID=UPI0025D07827|nr:folylpolyglutamate synthase/dihydrofolate synthase family protein [Phenylobacterium sp.]MCG9915507.1 bifunctional folylpolyglutamate synthase/dihydrofolate synthase [Phenylobacterium sp.]